MRHGKRNNHLSRTAAHRTALMRNLSCQLIEHKRIVTTQAKAKELRKFVEPLINRSKNDTTPNRRLVFSRLNNKEAVKELFDVVSDKVADRPGGYTRIIKLAPRLGDAAEMAMIELVDFNELYTKEEKKKTTRRSRRSTKKSEDSATTAAEDTKAEETAAPEETEATSAEVVAETETVAEETPEAEASTEETTDEAPKADDQTADDAEEEK